MWIEELPNGKYKYVERYEDPLTGKQKKVSLTHTKKNNRVEKEMFLKLQEKIEKIINQSNNRNDLTFGELVAEWKKAYKSTVKPATLTRADTHLRALLVDFEKVRLSKLQASQFNEFYLNNLQSGRFKYNTIKQMDSLIKRILTFAYKYKGYDLSGVSLLLDVPKINQSEKNELKYLEKEELQHVLDYFSNNDMEEYKRMAFIQASTGMRYSEMASLRFRDVNFKEYTLSVSRSYDFDNKVFTSPKTGNERIVFTNDSINKELKEQIQVSRLKTLRYNHDRTNDLLFKTEYGNPISTLSFNNRLKEVGIKGKNVTSHYFRHTFITLAIENKIDRDLIARQVGHADTTMIERVYSHFTKEMEKQQKEAMLEFKII